MPTKNQVNDKNADAKIVYARTGFIAAITGMIVLIVLVIVGAMWYVRSILGDNAVLIILGIFGVAIFMGIVVWVNDRNQERAMRFNTDQTLALAGGMSSVMAQNARTQGDMQRANIAVYKAQEIQNQRLEAARQLQDMRQIPQQFEFEDNNYDLELSIKELT